MKKYGQADVMCVLVHIFLERQENLTEDQKKEIESRSFAEITANYPSSADWELCVQDEKSNNPLDIDNSIYYSIYYKKRGADDYVNS